MMNDLVERAKNGDDNAYSELILLTRATLYRTALSILKNDADAQDAVQETFIRLYRNIHKIRDDKKFIFYATRIVKRVCYKMYRDNRTRVPLSDDDFADDGDIDEAILDISFDNIFSSLDDLDNTIFHIRFTDHLKIKEIARRLNMTESNVKSHLRRGRLKLREKHTMATLLTFALFMLIASGVIAVSITHILKNWFNLSDVGINNDGILMAIENLDYYQDVDMDYIDIGDGYKIKVDYLLMDEMSLYMIFDLESEKDLSRYTDVSLPDLRVIDENGNILCNKGNMDVEQYSQVLGSKFIESNSHYMKFLVYMYADSFPISRTLDIDFSKIVFYTKNMHDTDVNKLYFDMHCSIDLLEKFANRKHINYTSNDINIIKSIVTETGFYAIVESQNCIDSKIYLIDEFNNYNCYSYNLNDYGNFRYMIVCPFNNINNDKLSLKISEKYFNLIEVN